MARFQIGHAHIRVESDHPGFLARVTEWMEDFVTEHAPEDDLSAIEATFVALAPDEPPPFEVPPSAKHTHDNDTAAYYDDGERWYVKFRRSGLVVLERERLRLVGYVYPHIVLPSITAFEDFMHPLHELTRQIGLYPLHAASVEQGGRGLLLVGKSGQGKSTLCADLVSNGFRFLADDRCFVRETDAGFDMFAFYEPFKLFASNVSHIGALSAADELSGAPAAKQPLDLRKYYPDRVRLHSGIHGIVFPQWAPGAPSRAERVAPGKALVELLPLTLVCFDPAAGRAHFEFLGRLVGGLPIIRLFLGDDRAQWSRIAGEFLAESGER